MHGDMTRAGGRKSAWNGAVWGIAASLLLVPAIAMQFTSEVNWTASDFLVMAVLLGSVALGIQFLTGRSGSLAYRLGSVLAMISAFLIVWADLAVGMIGDGDNIYSLLFVGIIAIAAIGAMFARFEPAGMARAMFVAATAHVAVAAAGFAINPHGATISMAMAVLWIGSAILFAKAARHA